MPDKNKPLKAQYPYIHLKTSDFTLILCLKKFYNLQMYLCWSLKLICNN